ncbi:ribitol operon repressor [Klebsiella pneumoniae]|uniref:Ribitol operon repressor n=1 Tax=Klebsiella pneumoniae TaxID=573 RepID=A0A2X3EV31_KLEPN|nr:ribitol operon repressor [Klebsiella pneumoniae]
MIIPKYDNRYFGSIAERFEEMARERGLLPIITCTRRRPELEIEAVKAMLSWQVDWVVATGRPIRINFRAMPAGGRANGQSRPAGLSLAVGDFG